MRQPVNPSVSQSRLQNTLPKEKNTVINRECYYPSTRTENKGLLALFSAHQGRWVDLLPDRLGLAQPALW